MPDWTLAVPTVVFVPSTKQILRLGLALGRSDGGRLARLAVRLDKLDDVAWVVELTAGETDEDVEGSAELTGTHCW